MSQHIRRGACCRDDASACDDCVTAFVDADPRDRSPVPIYEDEEDDFSEDDE